jgi:hypothetical protein
MVSTLESSLDGLTFLRPARARIRRKEYRRSEIATEISVLTPTIVTMWFAEDVDARLKAQTISRCSVYV